MADKKRRTPPVERQVVEAEISSHATIKKRLIDFDTDSSILEEQHKQWLDMTMRPLLRLTEFTVKLHGFASKQGNAARNQALSMQRMKAVQSYLQGIDSRVFSSTRMLEENGENAATGSDQDDQSTAKWRAVEIHIFDQNPPPPEPPGKEVKPNVVPLPGGERHQKWAIAAPGGFTFAAIVGVGFNIVVIKTTSFLTMSEEKRAYLHIVGGLGKSIGLKDPTIFRKILEIIITGFSASKVSYTPVASTFPVTWQEMEKSDVLVDGGTAAVISKTHFWFNTVVTHHGTTGLPVATGEPIFDFLSESIGIGLGFFGGPGFLMRVPQLDGFF